MSKGFLSRGLTWDTKEWKVGYYANTRLNDDPPLSLSQCRKHHLIIDEGIMWYIDGSTRGLDTGLEDKDGKQIFEGDIIKCTYHGYIEIYGQVKFGEYLQDGSGGEYEASKCIGFYLEVLNKNAEDEWGLKKTPEHVRVSSLLDFESLSIFGNIHELPDLTEVLNEKR